MVDRPHVLPPALLARYASVEREVHSLRQANLTLRNQLIGAGSRPRASAAPLRRIAEEAEKQAAESASIAIQHWVSSSLDHERIVSSLLLARLREARQGDDKAISANCHWRYLFMPFPSSRRWARPHRRLLKVPFESSRLPSCCRTPFWTAQPHFLRKTPPLLVEMIDAPFFSR